MNKHIGRWVLEELHCYNPYSGITNNMSESLNRVIKDLQQWKEAPVDCMVLALYQLQAYYLKEIRRGLGGIGEYSLWGCYSALHANVVDYVQSKSPEDIVIGIKNSTADLEVAPENRNKAPSMEKPTATTRNLSSIARAKLQEWSLLIKSYMFLQLKVPHE